MKERECDNCNNPTPKRFLGKINGLYLCKKCRIELRKNHRKQTIKESGIKEELQKLSSKIKKEREYSRKSYEKRIGHKVINKNYQPIIKGAKIGKPIHSYNLFLSFQEKKCLFRILRQRGMSERDVKERIKDLIEEQQRLGKIMKKENKTKLQIKQKQQELLEELWK